MMHPFAGDPTHISGLGGSNKSRRVKRVSGVLVFLYNLQKIYIYIYIIYKEVKAGPATKDDNLPRPIGIVLVDFQLPAKVQPADLSYVSDHSPFSF